MQIVLQIIKQDTHQEMR